MALEAVLRQVGDSLDYTPDAALTAGAVVQIKDGRAAVPPSDIAASTLGAVSVRGVYRLQKTADIAILDGGRVYWDHSANKAHFKRVNDRDFYVGRAVEDSAAAATTVLVALNVDPPYDIDVLRDAALSVPVGTQAVGGFGHAKVLGGALSIELTATLEAQKIDLLSVDGFAKGAKAIVEMIFRVPDGSAGGAPDLNIGVASATHASDADAIAESVFIHVNGNDLKLYAESDDGTTEVAATDTTKVFVAGSAVANRVEVWIDLRDPASVKIYVEGVRVLSGTTFNVNAAAGPLFLLAHLEKTSAADTARAVIDALRARFSEQ